MCQILDYKIKVPTLVQFEQTHSLMTYTQMIGGIRDFVSERLQCPVVLCECFFIHNTLYTSKLLHLMMHQTFIRSPVFTSFIPLYNNNATALYDNVIAFYLGNDILKPVILSLIIEPPHDKTNKMACAPSKAWPSAQSDQSPLSAWRKLGSSATRWAQAKTLIRLVGCPGWSESSLDAHVILLVLSWGSSIIICDAPL